MTAADFHYTCHPSRYHKDQEYGEFYQSDQKSEPVPIADSRHPIPLFANNREFHLRWE